MSIHSCGIGHNQGPVLGHDDADDALDAHQAAAFLGIAIVTLWRQVERGDLPMPFYPKGELRLAREALRMLPRDAKAARRAARITAERGTTNTAET